MMKQNASDQTESYWGNLDHQSTEDEVKERARRAAAASRGLREHSRRGAGKLPTFKLLKAVSNNEK
ncbi:hypothetical protein CsSME_00027496 [Camellia sinensis var. sinensis]